MATSRRRERELARRRFERRRQAELERRAKAKKRNTVVGAVTGTVVVIVALVLIGVTVFGGGSSKKKPAATPSLTPSANPTATATTAANTQPAPKKCAKIKPNPPAKGQPTIPDVKGKDPTKLVVKNIKKGHGPAAKAGDDVKVTYIGVGCSTGTVFDATYRDGGTPFDVMPLGQASVIEGWNEGLIGIKAGGTRELIIPGPLAYASTPASAPTFGNDTLIFLVKANSVTPAQ